MTKVWGNLLSKSPLKYESEKESESEVSQSCPTHCDPMDCSLPDSSVRGIFQARVLEWVPISFSRGSSRPKDRIRASCISCIGRQILYHSTTMKYLKVKSFSRVRLFATPWTVAYQAPQSVEFSRQEYWSGFPFPSPGDLPNPGIEPRSPALQADALLSEPPGKLPWNTRPMFKKWNGFLCPNMERYPRYAAKWKEILQNNVYGVILSV